MLESVYNMCITFLAHILYYKDKKVKVKIKKVRNENKIKKEKREKKKRTEETKREQYDRLERRRKI